MTCIQANGVYSLTNVKGGTCMDLSLGDNHSITGHGCYQGINQTWVFENADGDQTYYVKSAASGQYLAAAGEPRDGRKVVAAQSPYAWRVEDEQGVECGVRLSPASHTNFCVDLSDHGSSVNGTPVQLWSRLGDQRQVWKARKVQ